MEFMDFVGFPKMPRLSREVIITEKLDGTNGQIYIAEDGVSMSVGSRNRWITPSDDNMGFARWCDDNYNELLTLGPGRHFGEWWGQKIQRTYGLKERRFSLFNTLRWEGKQPSCCHVVPVIKRGIFCTRLVDDAMAELIAYGSKAAPGFQDPEGVIVYHLAGNFGMKKTLIGDEEPKGVYSRRSIK